jgi:DNA polymerase-3 subunit delta'
VSEAADIPEADRVEGAPHPRAARDLFGQADAEAAVLAAHAAGRMPHAWLLAGPRGIGKATLAWRAARFLLTAPGAGAGGGPPVARPPSASLATDPAHPVARRIAALTEPRLHLVRRGWDDQRKALRTQIGIDEVRALRGFLQLRAADGGTRVAILDSADEMTAAAANGLLKILEEPPPQAVLFLVCHRPAALLPTIRSRCRMLRLAPLGPDDLARALAAAGIAAEAPAALAELARGSVGEAVRLLAEDGPALYAQLLGLWRPRLDRAAALRLAEGTAGRANEARLDALVRLIEVWLARLAAAGAGRPRPEAAPGEAALGARLAPDLRAAQAWADLAPRLSERARRARAVNLDPPALILDMLVAIDRTAAEVSAL